VWHTIAKLWKQPRCPTTDEWIKKMWYLGGGGGRGGEMNQALYAHMNNKRKMKKKK
jgi:hypothetical protein